MIKLLCFVLGMFVAAVVVLAGMHVQRPILFDDTIHQQARLWGRYWESRMGFEYAMMDHDTGPAHQQRTRQWAEENHRCFDELKRAQLIVPATYDWRHAQETETFFHALTGVPTYRWGYSLEGGQWPVGIEYIDNLSMPDFPKQFLRR